MDEVAMASSLKVAGTAGVVVGVAGSVAVSFTPAPSPYPFVVPVLMAVVGVGLRIEDALRTRSRDR